MTFPGGFREEGHLRATVSVGLAFSPRCVFLLLRPITERPSMSPHKISMS